MPYEIYSNPIATCFHAHRPISIITYSGITILAIALIGGGVVGILIAAQKIPLSAGHLLTKRIVVGTLGGCSVIVGLFLFWGEKGVVIPILMGKKVQKYVSESKSTKSIDPRKSQVNETPNLWEPLTDDESPLNTRMNVHFFAIFKKKCAGKEELLFITTSKPSIHNECDSLWRNNKKDNFFRIAPAPLPLDSYPLIKEKIVGNNEPLGILFMQSDETCYIYIFPYRLRVNIILLIATREEKTNGAYKL